MAYVSTKSWWGLASNIISIADGMSKSDDTKYSIRQVIFWIKIYFSDILADELEKKKQGIMNFKIDPYFINDLGCVPLEQADEADCDCAKSGCTVLRTPILPKFVSIFGKSMITYIGNINKQEPFTFTIAENVKGQSQNRFTSQTFMAYLKNDRVYAVIPKSKADSILSCINIQGITEDVTAVVQQCGENTRVDTCFDLWSEDVPIPEKYIRRITLDILQKEMGISMQITADKINDGSAPN